MIGSTTCPVSNDSFVFVAPSSTSITAAMETSPAGNKLTPEILQSPNASADSQGFPFHDAAFSPDDANFDFGGSATDFNISTAQESSFNFVLSSPLSNPASKIQTQDSSFNFGLASPSPNLATNESGFSMFNNPAESPQSSMFTFDSSKGVGNSFDFDSPSSTNGGGNFNLSSGAMKSPAPGDSPSSGNGGFFNFGGSVASTPQPSTGASDFSFNFGS